MESSRHGPAGSDDWRESQAQEPIPGTADEVKRKRQANVYDAVAGRVTTTETLAGPLSRGVRSVRGIYSLRDATLAPEQVLFQRSGAPQRYAEKDVYFSREADAAAAADNEQRGNRLPDSDLLKAVHAYAAHLYEAVGRCPGGGVGRSGRGPGRDSDRDPACYVGSRHIDERSMDETALIAFGVLLEEAGREVLGRRGDLVFTEGIDEELLAPSASSDGYEADEKGQQQRAQPYREVSVGPSDGEAFWRRRYKRRKRNDEGLG